MNIRKSKKPRSNSRISIEIFEMLRQIFEIIQFIHKSSEKFRGQGHTQLRTIEQFVLTNVGEAKPLD
jgi:hypothetical protein